MDVDQVFVPLALDLGGRDLSFSSSNFLKAGNRLLIVGDPGCGKSTLLKQAFRQACRWTRVTPTKGHLPIRLELKRFTPPKDIADDRDAGNWLFNQIKDSVGQVEGFEIAELFDTWVADNGLLVLLDGLDEVASDNYSLMASALRGLSHILAGLSSNNQLVVSMRVQFHQQIRADLMGEYPQSLYVHSFTPNEIYTFLNRWPFEQNSRKLYINKIYETLTDRPTLRDMCSNPLILAMYVENHYESSAGDIPDTRTQFYEKVVNELLFRRRQRQEVTTGRFISLRDQREAILGELAFQNLTDPSQPPNSLSWSTAINIAARTWRCGLPEAEIRLKELATETGLIVDERTAETIRFIHLTFCEFFAAVECARGRRNGWATLLSAHRKFLDSGVPQLQSRLVEVLPFAHAILPRVDRPTALADIAVLDDRLVLGRCFLETQLYGEPEWTAYLDTERAFLANKGKQGWDDSLLRRLHLFSVVVRDARDWHTQIMRTKVDQLENVFSVIVGGSRDAFIRVFITYASQDAAAAMRLADDIGVNIAAEYPELAIKSCKEVAFLALALDKATSDHGGMWATIMVEAALRYSNVAHELCSKSVEAFSRLRIADHKTNRVLYVPKDSLYSVLLAHVLAGNDSMLAIEALREFVQNSSRFYWMCRANSPQRRVTGVGAPFGLIFLIVLFFTRSHINFTSPLIIAGICLSGLFLITFIIAALLGDIVFYAPRIVFDLVVLPDIELSSFSRSIMRKFFHHQWRALQTLKIIRTLE